MRSRIMHHASGQLHNERGTGDEPKDDERITVIVTRFQTILISPSGPGVVQFFGWQAEGREMPRCYIGVQEVDSTRSAM
jgi:hypothetical protein